MTKADKTTLLYFITRTGMYINPVDDRNVASFIHGYELGTKRKCDFTRLSKELLADKYKIGYSSDGWTGQIERLAEKLSLSWLTTFKKVALEIVANEDGGLDEEMKQILKTRIASLIGRINAMGDPWFNQSWIEEWLSLCLLKSKWFKQLWTADEWTIVKAIDKQVQTDNIFNDKDDDFPAPQLIKLKQQYDKATKKNGIQQKYLQ